MHIFIQEIFVINILDERKKKDLASLSNGLSTFVGYSMWKNILRKKSSSNIWTRDGGIKGVKYF